MIALAALALDHGRSLPWSDWSTARCRGRAPAAAGAARCAPDLADYAGAREALLRAARGHYQRALAEGSAAWSGADLAGRAKKYGGRYAASRDALLARAGLRTVLRYERGAVRRVLEVPPLWCERVP